MLGFAKTAYPNLWLCTAGCVAIFTDVLILRTFSEYALREQTFSDPVFTRFFELAPEHAM
jgi:hypothetical protein